MVTESGDLIVLAVQRAGEQISPLTAREEKGSVVLQAGDSVLLQGTWKALDVRLNDPNVLVVDSPDLVRRQAVPLGQGARHAIIILVAMVVLLATGLVPPAVAGLLAAGAIVLSRIMHVDQAYRAIDWTTVILVGAMMPLSTAMVESGAATMLADGLVKLVGDVGPLALLAGLFVVTAIMSQLISNTATALIMIPVAVAAAADMGVSSRPVLMSIAVAAAGAFLTPDCHADQPDGDGPRRLSVRRLLEARPAAAHLVLHHLGLLRAAHLALLSALARTRRQRSADCVDLPADAGGTGHPKPESKCDGSKTGRFCVSHYPSLYPVSDIATRAAALARSRPRPPLPQASCVPQPFYRVLRGS